MCSCIDMKTHAKLSMEYTHSMQLIILLSYDIMISKSVLFQGLLWTVFLLSMVLIAQADAFYSTQTDTKLTDSTDYTIHAMTIALISK